MTDPEKRRRLEARGWHVGTSAELLGLTPEEVAACEALSSLPASEVELILEARE